MTHLLVMALSVTTIAGISHVYKFTRFPRDHHTPLQKDLAAPPSPSPKLSEPQKELKQFQQIDLEATVIAVSFALLSISLLSVHVSRNIVEPLQKLESAMDAFVAGNFHARVPQISIPELHRLGLRFNHFAASLEGVEERRRQMTSDLAHEFRTPLTIIQGHLLMAQSGIAKLTPDTQTLLLQETQRLERLVNDLLELSTIEAGYLPLRLETIAPYRFLKGIVLTFAVKALQANCKLTLIEGSSLPPIYADPDRFQQILINLISNAITYSPNATVTVSSQITSGFAWFTVRDTGIGIAPEHLPVVFDRFWRADPSRRCSSSGSGIGLAIAKRLVEIQGGRITVESEVGRGTTFQFSMPLAHYVQCRTCPHAGHVTPCNLETCPLLSPITAPS
ncbi:MAG TPA: HAMP domain-containing sensor histidine kinase [Chroococcidiopsis sp.]